MQTVESPMSDIDEDDRRLFRSAVGEVKRLRTNRRAPVPHPKPTIANPRERDTREVMLSLSQDPQAYTEVQPGDTLFYARAGLTRPVVRRLRRGQYRIDAELDLHGMRLPEARRSVLEFIREACRRGLGCVRIVHGKGWRSGNEGPVLKPSVGHWLRQLDPVLAFCSATPADGGTGAVYVLLKTS